MSSSGCAALAVPILFNNWPLGAIVVLRPTDRFRGVRIMVELSQKLFKLQNVASLKFAYS